MSPLPLPPGRGRDLRVRVVRRSAQPAGKYAVGLALETNARELARDSYESMSDRRTKN